MAFTEDLDQFFDTTEFAVSATFTKTDLTTITASVIFTDESDQENVFDTAIERHAAYLTVPAADIPGIVRGNEVNVNSTDYLIERIEKDGIGLKNLYLKTKQS